MNRVLRIHAYGGADAISIDPSDLPTAVAHAANAIERNKTGHGRGETVVKFQ
jgi:hypothetical protein